MTPTVIEPGGRRRAEHGQAAVELAIVLPVVAVAALVLIQIGLVIRAQILVVHASREAARIAAVDASADLAEVAATSSGLERAHMAVTAGARVVGQPVSVTVTYSLPDDVPLVGPLVGGRALSSTTTMRVER